MPLQVLLFKFVRMAGDLLMPSLYTPYVEMLVSLAGHPQTALHCFNLLKVREHALAAVELSTLYVQALHSMSSKFFKSFISTLACIMLYILFLF